MGFIRKNLDLVFSLLLTLIFVFPLYYTGLLDGSLIFDGKLFLQLYLVIIIGVFAIFALFSTYINVLAHFKKKGKISILNKSFIYPIVSSIGGVIVVFINTILSWKILTLLNLFLFFYSSLSVLALFLTIYKIMTLISTK